MTSSFEQELAALINKHNGEEQSGTPDFILAKFLNLVLWSYNNAIMERTDWRGEQNDLGS
jgi:hypothetical protein